MKWISTNTEEYCLFADTDIGTFYIYNSCVLRKVSLYLNSVFIAHTSTIEQAKDNANNYVRNKNFTTAIQPTYTDLLARNIKESGIYVGNYESLYEE